MTDKSVDFVRIADVLEKRWVEIAKDIYYESYQYFYC